MLVENDFQVGDKVVCIDDSDDHGIFGSFPNSLKKGALYNVFAVHELNVRGLVIHVEKDDDYGYEARHFRLVCRP